jgi:hypothetical protein
MPLKSIADPINPKEGPLDSLVEHLVGVTREEPAHWNYDRDRCKSTTREPDVRWEVETKWIC